MKKVALLNASPKIEEKSASEEYLSWLESSFTQSEITTAHFSVRQSVGRKTLAQDFEPLRAMDALIFALPLYNFCLPGILTYYLEKFASFLAESKGDLAGIKIYALINCGFPEAQINLGALKALEFFSSAVQADFRLGILIGGGPMLTQVSQLPPFRKTKKKLDDAYAAITNDILQSLRERPDNVEISIHVPRKLYFYLATKNWYREAKQNNLEKSDLYRKPFVIK